MLFHEKNAIDAPYSFLNNLLKEFNLSATWLFSGEGDMFINQEVASHLSTEEPPGEYVFFKKKDEIHRLDVSAQEVAELKKKISDLEKEIYLLEERNNKDTAKLMDENKKLNDELVQRLRQLTEVQMLLIPKQQ